MQKLLAVITVTNDCTLKKAVDFSVKLIIKGAILCYSFSRYNNSWLLKGASHTLIHSADSALQLGQKVIQQPEENFF